MGRKDSVITSRESPKVIHISRCAYTYDEIDLNYPPLNDDDDKPPFKLRLSSVIPLINSVRNYKWRENLTGDCVSGLSVAFLHMPQGLAYGLLASLSPVSGLYSSFFAVMLYVVFGTCPHISMGTNSVLALITAAMVERELSALPEDYFSKNVSGVVSKEPTDEEEISFKLATAMTSAFGSGVLLFLMGLLRVGFVTSYMPSSFVGGFTAGAAVHIATSQVKHIFRIKVKSHSGVGKLIKTYQDLAGEIHKTNSPDVIISVSSMVVLLFFTIVINPRLKAKLGYDLPINLILVIMLTILSHFAEFHKRFHVSVVGEVPFGMPSPGIPDFAILPNIYVDILILTTISFAMTISMAMLMAKIHGYDIDSNQELIAYGICNVGCSFFFSQATSVSPPRTMILSNTGAKTMLNGIPTVLFLFIMFFAGGMLEALPIPYLAAMIIVSVKDLLLQFLSLKKIWKISKSDFVVWILTWLMTVFADLPWGIIAGMAIAIFGNIINNQLIQGSLIVVSNKEDLIIKGEHRLGVHSPTGIKIFYFPSQLFFANAEVFKKQMFNNVFDPTSSKDLSYHLDDDDSDEMALVTESVHCIIIDCSAMTYMDMDGVNMLKMVILLYRQAGVQMLLVRVGQDAMRVMENAELFQILPRSCIFHDVEDALANEQKTRVGVSRLSMTVTTPGREDSLDQFLGEMETPIF